jgi:hypothetical protein
MPTITLPPTGLGGSTTTKAKDGVGVVSVTAQCEEKTGDPLIFDVQHNGYLVRFGDGLFSPDIPDGPINAGSLVGPLFPQVSSGMVLIGYFDIPNNLVYVIPINIQPKCP